MSCPGSELMAPLPLPVFTRPLPKASHSLNYCSYILASWDSKPTLASVKKSSKKPWQ